MTEQMYVPKLENKVSNWCETRFLAVAVLESKYLVKFNAEKETRVLMTTLFSNVCLCVFALKTVIFILFCCPRKA